MNNTKRVLAALALAGVALTMSGPAYAETATAMTSSQTTDTPDGMLLQKQDDIYNMVFRYLDFPAGYNGTVKGKVRIKDV
ncbi:hypothetical protein OHB36_34650 [Streptomyces sp. NBC_00320]|uniref:hypothetical protein n=1 Tax=Streptomyces sp. NBC_00320 TaxID=2975711 RepID=UPI002259831C|nr:hypothetical protein [Streptomyces sp. NBC_00320]MCX5151831.1 hypothetical protein [Streptomyces sp. NBC_00320]